MSSKTVYTVVASSAALAWFIGVPAQAVSSAGLSPLAFGASAIGLILWARWLLRRLRDE